MTVVKVKKTVAKTKRSARMSDYAPILMPRWLHTVDPVARGAISRRIAEEFTLLMQREGVRAFEMPRSAACAHESGHAIVETVLGARVKSVQIHTCLQLRGLGSEAWGGVTLCHGDTGWGITEHTPTQEVRHRIYRMIAGIAGEIVLDSDNVRSGSSLDERVVARLITLNLHAREGRGGHPSETWRECWYWALTTIKRNEEVGRQLMVKLDAAKRLKGKPLEAILRRVRQIPDERRHELKGR
jgi:hypothetical protein